MKQLENKKITVLEQPQSYKDLIMACVLFPPQEGFTYELNKKIERIENIFEGKENQDKFNVEDADMDFIKSKVEPMKWSVYDRKLTQFQEYIKSL